MHLIIFIFFLVTELLPENFRFASAVLLILLLLPKHCRHVPSLPPYIWPLFSIIALTAISTLMFPSPIYNIIKGIVYISRPAVFILLGFLLVHEYREPRAIIRLIMVAGVVSCANYVFTYVTDPNVATADRTYIRRVIGQGSVMMPILLVLGTLTVTSQSLVKAYPRSIGVLMAGLALVTIVLTQSRSHLLIAIMMFLMFMRRIPRRFFAYLMIPGLIILIIIVATPILSLILDHHTMGTLEIDAPDSLNEILAVDRHSLREINDYWRGFETYTAFNYINAQGIWARLFGTGFGSEVALSFGIKLGEDVQTSLPIFHNGLSLIYVRSGSTGIFFYILQISLFAVAAAKLAGAKGVHAIIGSIMMGAVVNLCLTTPVVAGLFNHSGYIAMLMGILAGFLELIADPESLRDPRSPQRQGRGNESGASEIDRPSRPAFRRRALNRSR